MITTRTFIKHSVCSRHSVFSRVFHSKFSTKAMASECLLSNLKTLFSCGVSSVQPEHIFRADNLTIDTDASKIICNFNENRVTIDIHDSKRCHLVGFGKAVYGLASQLSKVLGNRLESGMISVPLNIHKNFGDIQLSSAIKVFEGAKNNLPDENAKRAAAKIVQFVKSLNKDDVLFVLISGGGSALLPLPCKGVSLHEKLDIIKKLASKGATITDINRVRIDLSETKGGKLANCARNAGIVITFIISDIIGDPIDLIASGPTVLSQNLGTEERSIDILKRFNLWDSLPAHIQKAISENATTLSLPKAENIQNIIIANNEIAVNAVATEAAQRQLKAIILSTKIEGNVSNLSNAYFELSKCIQAFKNGQINDDQFHQLVISLRETLSIRDQFLLNIKQIVHESKAEQMDLCIIGGGEPTVEITGNGIGGRNQELALRFGQLSFNDDLTQDVFLLAAGTDGIDGPTPAAGAIGGADIIRNYLMIPGKSQSVIDAFIQNNDSFSFYSNLAQGMYHIDIGHTGTNVMDLHLLYFRHKD
ncbi:glycerate kinase [Sitodiplosis mosellana]|uniref:glycerate kinase n=1 Tax=Sitodiplosis mosellana TaxID=263140 RepID=UPI002443A0C4|nr:glycerate kinase [Sitodiplosis mosellana]